MTDLTQEKSLEQLENDCWGDPGDSSFLVEECYRLRRKPIGDFTIENLRILIGQNIGLEYTIPLALDRLAENPWAEGDYFPGDLLLNVLRCEHDYWSGHNEQLTRLNEIVERLREQAEQFEKDIKPLWTAIFSTSECL